MNKEMNKEVNHVKLQTFAIYDEKAEVYSPPMYLAHTGEAIRSFQDMVNNKQSKVNQHPEDYTLYCLGTYTQATGKFENLPEPKVLERATSLIKREEN